MQLSLLSTIKIGSLARTTFYRGGSSNNDRTRARSPSYEEGGLLYLVTNARVPTNVIGMMYSCDRETVRCAISHLHGSAVHLINYAIHPRLMFQKNLRLVRQTCRLIGRRYRIGCEG
jgi:hypothetical protein